MGRRTAMYCQNCGKRTIIEVEEEDFEFGSYIKEKCEDCGGYLDRKPAMVFKPANWQQ